MPHVSTIPAVGLRIPAMIEMRVVLPQPDGPTSMVSSPAGAPKLIPWSTSTNPPPAGTDLVTPLHRTAIDGARIAPNPETRWRGRPPRPLGGSRGRQRQG